MSSPLRAVFFNPRPLWSLVATTRARRAYATIPTKNPNPAPPKDDSKEQAMPIGRFYEAILNTPQSVPEVKPEEPASTVKKAQGIPEPEASPEPAKRGRKPKAKTEPAATATAGNAPTASPAASATETAKEVADKASSLSSSASAPPSKGTSPPVPTPPPTESSGADKAKVVFGTRLAGPTERAERLAQIRSKSHVVAGVIVPPKPEEPDNCCMSGCVNCVWDLYRDEMEEWAAANAEAERRVAAEKAEEAGASAPIPPTPLSGPDRAATLSMDDDGGGSETNWNVGGAVAQAPGKIAKDFWDEDLYKNVPVGIREFMKQEKKLKEKHIREGTTGG
ncbi:hypothetical protein VM1G_05314 [Cytospora mali]|uniref:Oxidoreductase-like domain-containing protein n=1 Tax=Cytospora mali TaxID=578113 RepID=A0A194W1U6_CYTMA|nr:hypothetical protein VM1G_05314 [Valsa mali]